MQKLQKLSSFERCNESQCRFVYTQLNASRTSTVELGLEDEHAPLQWGMPTYTYITGRPGVPQNYDYHYDIPGHSFMLGPPDPSFYLPEQLRQGRNCAEVRDKKQQKQVASATTGDLQSSTSAAADASSDSALPPFEEWCLSMLLDTELQARMEAAGVLNSWNEGSHLSVVKTDGDGNCLCHALLIAAYGLSDSSGGLRECGQWELGSTARRTEYLERFMAESQREINLARSLEAPAAGAPGTPPAAAAAASAAAAGGAATAAAVASAVPRALDADDRRNLEKDFESLIASMSKLSNYLEPIHIFALAHVLRRPIIVYGKQRIGGADAQQHPDAQPRHAGGAEEERKEDAAAAAASDSQQNCMVGIYLPLMWRTQHRLSDLASKDNPHLKPLCLLYSCADERTGAGGHFSALVHTDGMWPEPPMVPLQQYDGYSSDANFAGAVPLVNRTRSLPSAQPLPLLPVRFLLPKDNVHHLLNKHLDVMQTAQGAWYARYPVCRPQLYIQEGWTRYLFMAQDHYARQSKSGQEALAVFENSGMMLSASPDADANTAAVLAALSPSPVSPASSLSVTDEELLRGSDTYEVEPDDEGDDAVSLSELALQTSALGGRGFSLWRPMGNGPVPHHLPDIPDDAYVLQLLNDPQYSARIKQAIQQAADTFTVARTLPWALQLRLLQALYHSVSRLESAVNRLDQSNPLRSCVTSLSLQRFAWVYMAHYPLEVTPRVRNDAALTDADCRRFAQELNEHCNFESFYTYAKRDQQGSVLLQRFNAEATATYAPSPQNRAPPVRPVAPVPVPAVRPTPVAAVNPANVRAAAGVANAVGALPSHGAPEARPLASSLAPTQQRRSPQPLVDDEASSVRTVHPPSQPQPPQPAPAPSSSCVVQASHSRSSSAEAQELERAIQLSLLAAEQQDGDDAEQQDNP